QNVAPDLGPLLGIRPEIGLIPALTPAPQQYTARDSDQGCGPTTGKTGSPSETLKARAHKRPGFLRGHARAPAATNHRAAAPIPIARRAGRPEIARVAILPPVRCQSRYDMCTRALATTSNRRMRTGRLICRRATVPRDRAAPAAEPPPDGFASARWRGRRAW